MTNVTNGIFQRTLEALRSPMSWFQRIARRETSGEYDVFFSHAWADGTRPQKIADALVSAGLRVWFDAKQIDDFEGITHAVTEGLAKSKVLLAYYSQTYPLRRGCQWELTAGVLAAQAAGDPRERVLVINPEASSGHIHPIELRDAKYPHAAEDQAALAALAQSIRRRVRKLTGSLADIHPLEAPNWYGMAPVGSRRFVGRLKEMWEVHSALHAGDVVQITGASAASGGIAQVRGLGGVGKSLLVEEYALHFGAAYPGGIFWLRAFGNDASRGAPTETLRADQVQDIAERLGIDTQGLTARKVEGALAREIERRGKPCLWVVDDVPSGLGGQELRSWFAPHALARTLLTTRSREYSSLGKDIDLSVLTHEESHQLLTSRRAPASNMETEQARLLARDLGRHALALDVAASALVSYGGEEPFRKFRGELELKEKDALELATELADALPNAHEASIAQTLLRSIRRLGVEGQDFLVLASILATAPIPASLVWAAFEEVDGLQPDDAERRQRKAFHDVTMASLAEVTGDSHSERTVHTLISRAVRFDKKLASQRSEALQVAGVKALRKKIAEAADPNLHPGIEFHVAHARHLILTPRTVDEAILLGWVARYDYERGRYASAKTLYERQLDFFSLLHGKEHPLVLSAQYNVGRTLQQLGKLAAARQQLEEVLQLRERILPQDDPDTVRTRGALAATLHAQGHLVEAKKLQEQVLETSLRFGGDDHPQTLSARNNLAITLGDLGDLDGERQEQEHVWEVRQRVLGDEHLDTIIARHNLATTLHALGEWSKALDHLEKVVKAFGRALGDDHPTTLTARSVLASTLYQQGDLAGARKQQEFVLVKRLELLGGEHPSTLSARNNLAQTLLKQGFLVEARQHQEEVLEMSRRVLGDDHHDTLNVRNNLAGTLNELGDLAGAAEQFASVLEVRQRLLTPHHFERSVSAWNLFGVLHAQGNRQAAKAVMESELLWMLQRDLGTLGAKQTAIREKITTILPVYFPPEEKTTHCEQFSDRICAPDFGGDDRARISRVARQKKTGRNDPCPCGSGKKCKRCCGPRPTLPNRTKDPQP